MLFVGLSKTTTLCNIARRSLMEGLTVREKFNKRWKLLSGNFFGMEPSLAMTLSTTGSCPYSWYLWVIFSKVPILLKHCGYSSSFLSEPSTSQFSNKNIEMSFLVACLVRVDPSNKLLHSLWSNKKVWHDIEAVMNTEMRRRELIELLYMFQKLSYISSPNQWFCADKKSASQNLSFSQEGCASFYCT